MPKLEVKNLPDLPVILILTNLSLNEIENCLEALPNWSRIIACHFFQQYLKVFTKLDYIFKAQLESENWHEFCQDTELILTLWTKFQPHKSRILVTTGTDSHNSLPHAILSQNELETEVINLEKNFEDNLVLNVILDHQKFQQKYGCMGEILQDVPIICGGYRPLHRYFKDIVVLNKNVTKSKKNQMLDRRAFGNSVKLKSNLIWLVGGWDRDFHNMDSTEFLTMDENCEMISRPGPKLPFTIRSHAMIKYNENSVILMGGAQNDQWSQKTWICSNYFRENEDISVEPGPDMKFVRHSHACAKMVFGEKVYLVVTGGVGAHYRDYLKSVEILEVSETPMWISGKYSSNLILH